MFKHIVYNSPKQCTFLDFLNLDLSKLQRQPMLILILRFHVDILLLTISTK